MVNSRISVRRPAVARRQPTADEIRTTQQAVAVQCVPAAGPKGQTSDAVKGVPRDCSGWPRYETTAFAGHVSAGEGTGNMLYYWFAPAVADRSAGPTPLVIWLNGGPGASSMAGMLWENGPFTLDEQGSVQPSGYPWNLGAHMLYWDNPVGTGYSYNTEGSPDCYVRNERQMAWQFVNALAGFYEIHPEYRTCPLYLAGESYAGKYIPYIALEILYRNLTGNGIPMPLTGLAIGDGWMVPVSQSKDQIDYAFNLGILDTVQRDKAMSLWDELARFIDKGDFRAAKDKDDALMTMIAACGGGENLYDVREFSDLGLEPLRAYLNNEFVKDCFNVPPAVTWECSDESGPVSDALVDDIMRQVDDLIPLLVDFPATAHQIIEWHDENDGSDGDSVVSKQPSTSDKLKMLFYTGTFDLSCGFLGTEQMLRDMQWSGRNSWLHLHRQVWSPSGTKDTATQGCIKQFDNLTQVEIPKAGHMIPLSQPAINRDMIYRWIQGVPFPTYDPAPESD